MKNVSLIVTAAAAMFVAAALVAADKPATTVHTHHDHHTHLTNAVVVVMPTKGNDVHGVLTMTATSAGVEVAGEVSGLTPGKHGFHIHEFGDLRDPAGKSAGGHYNPDGHQHGGPGSESHHAGDLGNIVADKDGMAQVKVTATGVKLEQIVGRSIVIHAGEDDLKSQPAGDSGDRIAVGVIAVTAAPKADMK